MQSPQHSRSAESHAETISAPAMTAPASQTAGQSHGEAPRGGEHEKLLLQVIEATLHGDDESLSDGEWEAVCSVARAHPACDLELGILSELVAAFIAERFKSLADDPQLVQRMSMRIAGSLWTHAASKGRLHRFWQQISEHAS